MRAYLLLAALLATSSNPVAALRVACIGDDITFGSRGLGGHQFTLPYPAALQQLLGSAEVENLGTPGATLGRASSTPIWDQPAFRALTSGQWDAVVIMMGTNDAQNDGAEAASWPRTTCDGAQSRSSGCPFWSAYEDLIATVRSLRRPASTSSPRVFVAIPPPMLHDGARRINQTVVNRVLPALTRRIAASAGVDGTHVIDTFDGMSAGLAVARLPSSGCSREDAASSIASPLRALCQLYCDPESCDEDEAGRNMGLHPSEKGHLQIAHTIANSLADALPTDVPQLASAGHFLGCFKDGNGSHWPVYHHYWAQEGQGVRLDDIGVPDATICTDACRARGYSLAGLIWNGPDVLSPEGYSWTQCYCAHRLGAFAEPERLLAPTKCCPTCMNYDLGPFPEGAPCLPHVHGCGAWMTMSTFWLGAPVDAPSLPPPPEPVRFNHNPCADPTSPHASAPWCDATLPDEERAADAVSALAECMKAMPRWAAVQGLGSGPRKAFVPKWQAACRMTLREKIWALGTGGLPDKPSDLSSWKIDSLGLDDYSWWQEASHGIAVAGDMPATNFILPLTAAQSFNRSLWHANGRQIGREGRAGMNEGKGMSTFWAPVVNLASEPRWGRNLETAGEDPFLSGQYAVSWVKGLQEFPGTDRLLASANCKHYVNNQMEHSEEAGVTWDRLDFDAQVTNADFLDSYMPPFWACVEQGQVSGLMCSYNAVNGVPTCANEWLLTTVARGEWGFDGYIVTDCGAGEGVYSHHNYADSPEEAVAQVLGAGVDIDCSGELLVKYAPSALDSGLIEERQIDEALMRTMKMRIRLANFDPHGPLNDLTEEKDVCNEHARDLARDGAAQSTVLLKNHLVRPATSDREAQRRLPLDPNEAGTVAVIGPNANLSMTIAGYYGPANACPLEHGRWPNMVDAVTNHAARVVTHLGVPSTESADTSHIAEAEAMARAASTVVMVVGTDLAFAREGSDAPRITMSSAQLELIERVATAAHEPIVLVLMSSTPLDIAALLANRKVGAIVHAGFPSVQCEGVGDVLFHARGAAPAARLVQTIYDASFAEQISIFDSNLRPGPSLYPAPTCAHATSGGCPNGTNPGRTYRFYTGVPVLPFGFGLSYTSFEYELVGPSLMEPFSLERIATALATTTSDGRTFPAAEVLEAAADPPLISFSVQVTNTGLVDSDEVVLGFLVPPNAGVDGTPKQQLFAFERVRVLAGSSVTVTLTPGPMDFTMVDPDTGAFVPRPGQYWAKFGVLATVAQGGGYVESGYFDAVMPSPRSEFSLAGKSLYFVMIDRFAKAGPTAADKTGCGGNVWCGGNIKGIKEHIDYIQGMGFDCLWLSPVVGQPEGDYGVSGTGYHGYWAEDWYAIDRHFGTSADLQELSAAIHERGMCVVLDIVLNHVRPIHGAADVARVSPFNQTTHYHTLRAAPGETFDAYTTHPLGSLGAFGPGCGPGDYKCEGGYDEAAVLNGWFYDLADLNQSHPFVRSELKRWVRHMVDTYGFDALRLDTAAYVPMDFLSELRDAAGVEILGEVTAANISYHASFTASAKSGGGNLDGVLNFPVYYELGKAFCGADSVRGALFETDYEQENGPADFHPLVEVLGEQSRARYASLDMMGIFADNHDVDRLATTCRSDLSRIANSLAFVLLMRGVPIVYSGTEQGLLGVKENENRYSLWADAGYDTTAPLYVQIKALNKVRREHLSGVRGTLPARTVSVTNTTIVMARGDHLLLFLNNRKAYQMSWPIRYCLSAREAQRLGSGSYDALSGSRITVQHAVDSDCPWGLPYSYVAADGAPKAVVVLPDKHDAAPLQPLAVAWRWCMPGLRWCCYAGAVFLLVLLYHCFAARLDGRAWWWLPARLTTWPFCTVGGGRARKKLVLAKMAPRDECWVLTEHDAPFNVKTASDAWLDLWGYIPEEAIGQPISGLINGPGTNTGAGRALMDRLRRDGYTATGRCTNASKHGERHTHTLSVVKVPQGWLAVSTDITTDYLPPSAQVYQANAALEPAPRADPAAWVLCEVDDPDAAAELSSTPLLRPAETAQLLKSPSRPSKAVRRVKSLSDLL